MALAITITSVQESQGTLTVLGYIKASGNYATGGDTLNFATATADPKFSGISPVIPAASAPRQLWIERMAGNITDIYFPILGSGITNCLMKIATAFGTELAAGAYPGGVTGDVIGFEAEFALFQ